MKILDDTAIVAVAKIFSIRRANAENRRQNKLSKLEFKKKRRMQKFLHKQEKRRLKQLARLNKRD